MKNPRADLRSRLRNEKALEAAVVGGGRSGRSAAALLAERGARVTILDDRPEGIESIPGGVQVRTLEPSALEAAELVVLSPGVPRVRPELHAAIAAGKLIGEIELAAWCLALPMVGITGTNGKSTTTALLGEMLRAAGRRPFVGGNFGTPLADLARAPGGYDLAVVELSSYQLESLEEARFEVGVWLNLQPDHLDRYPDLAAYARAKARLLERVKPEGTIVAKASDPIVERWVIEAGKRTRWFGAELGPDREGTRFEGTRLDVAGASIRVEAPGLLGAHNVENAAAAVEAALAVGAPLNAVQEVLSSFEGLPHRLQLVHEAAGVRWYDDSKATNVASAVTSVLAMPAPAVLIAGGKDKGGSWVPLVEAARRRVERVFAIGEAASLVTEVFDGVVPVEACQTMERAVERARTEARPGHCVLLAPACASFDQFRSYVDRGEQFARLAREEVPS